MIRVLLVDDHHILRDGLAQLLKGEPLVEVVGQASDGKEALDFLVDKAVDVILMDISMPGMDGVEATAHIRTRYPNIRIIALTMQDQGSFVQVMLRNGASGYLLKTTNQEELVEAIKAVHNGDRYLGKQATDLLLNTVSRQQTGYNALLPVLSRREREVLGLIMEGLTDSGIAERLFISPSTAESHRKNLRSKLGARNSAEIVRIAMERGLLER